MTENDGMIASGESSQAPTRAPYAPLDCSVRYILKGLNTFSVWVSIRPFFATPEEAVREEADYRKTYMGKKKYGDGWKDFCVVKQTTTEEFHTPNPKVRDGAPQADNQSGGNDHAS